MCSSCRRKRPDVGIGWGWRSRAHLRGCMVRMAGLGVHRTAVRWTAGPRRSPSGSGCGLGLAGARRRSSGCQAPRNCCSAAREGLSTSIWRAPRWPRAAGPWARVPVSVIHSTPAQPSQAAMSRRAASRAAFRKACYGFVGLGAYQRLRRKGGRLPVRVSRNWVWAKAGSHAPEGRQTGGRIWKVWDPDPLAREGRSRPARPPACINRATGAQAR